MKKTIIYPYILVCYIAISLLTGCITPYEPKDLEQIGNMLVVEGSIIAPYGTQIKLSRTQPISHSGTDDKPEYPPILTATVALVTDNGETVAIAKPTDSAYEITDSISFQDGKKYAIQIQLDGKEYQSEFVEPQITPEIDKVNFSYKELQQVDIRISTHNDDPNGARYYHWSYEEDWEIKSEYFAKYTWDFTNGLVKQDINTSNNVYYCWSNKSSDKLLLGKSDDLSKNIIKDHTLLSLFPQNSRFSYLYSITVRQQAIDKKTYEYLENLRKNVEQTGGIFAPQPTEIKGNITCLTHPEEVVIGYINAATETMYRLYIHAEEVPGMVDEYDCSKRLIFAESELAEAYGQGYSIFTTGIFPDTYVCMPYRCVNCTMRGGTKHKPDFWPNDHL